MRKTVFAVALMLALSVLAVGRYSMSQPPTETREEPPTALAIPDVETGPPAAEIAPPESSASAATDEGAAHALRQEFVELVRMESERMGVEELRQAVEELRLRRVAAELEAMSADLTPGSFSADKARVAAVVLRLADRQTLDDLIGVLDPPLPPEQAELPGEPE